MSALEDLTIPLIPDRYYHIFNRGINRDKIFFKEENFRYFLLKYREKMDGYVDTFGYCLLKNHFHLFIRVKPLSEILSRAEIDFPKVNETFLKEYVRPWATKLDMAGWGAAGGGEAAAADLANFKNLLNLIRRLTWVKTQGTHPATPLTYPEFPTRLDQTDFATQLASWVVSERLRGFMLGYAKAINKQEKRTGSLLQKGFRRKYVTESKEDFKAVLAYIHHNPIHHAYTNQYEDYLWSSYQSYLKNLESNVAASQATTWFGNQSNFLNYHEHYKSDKRKIFEWMHLEE
jgi:putative transposase